MYGVNETQSAAGVALAVTGLSTGASILAILGIIFVIIGVVALVRKGGKDRP